MVEYVIYNQKSGSTGKFLKWLIIGFLLLVCVLLPLYADELRYSLSQIIKKILFIIGTFTAIIGGFMLIIGFMGIIGGRLNFKNIAIGAILLYIGVWLMGITMGTFPEWFSNLGGEPINDPGYH